MKSKVMIIVLLLLVLLTTGCEWKKEKSNKNSVEVIRTINPIDQQLNCSKDITDQMAMSAENIRIVNYVEMTFSGDALQDYSIIYDVTFGENYHTDAILNTVGRLEENFLSLYNLENDKVVISTREIAPRRYNIKTNITYKFLTKEEKEKINMQDIGIYDSNLKALEGSGFICQTSI